MVRDSRCEDAADRHTLSTRNCEPRAPRRSPQPWFQSAYPSVKLFGASRVLRSLTAFRRSRLLNLLPEGAPLGQSRDTTCRLAEHRIAASAENDRLRMAVDRRDLEASRALDVHEVAVGALDQALQLV